MSALSRNAQHFIEHGYCIVEDALPRAHVEVLRSALSTTLEAKQRRTRIRPCGPPAEGETSSDYSAGLGGNHGYNRWNARLPSRPVFLTSAVVAHPAVTSLLAELRAYLGESREWALTLLGCDINLPNSGDQRPHRDAFTFDVTVNCPLVDVDDDMGPIEVWPGTHLRDDGVFVAGPASPARERAAHRAEWAELRKRPSRRLHLRAGTFVIRDQRMLHRGTANRTPEVRPMLSLYYDLWGAHARPHPAVLDAVGTFGRALRRLGHRLPLDEDRRFHLLNSGSGICLALTKLAGTDRDIHHRVARTAWDCLDADSRRLLRFALVEGGTGGMPASLTGSVVAIRHAIANAARLATNLVRPERPSLRAAAL